MTDERRYGKWGPAQSGFETPDSQPDRRGEMLMARHLTPTTGTPSENLGTADLGLQSEFYIPKNHLWLI